MAHDRAWWTVRQLAVHYGLSVRSVYDMIEHGQLAAHRFGAARGALRIADQDRLDWEQRSRQGPAAPRWKPASAPDPNGLIEKHLHL